MRFDTQTFLDALCLSAGPNHLWVALALTALGVAAGLIGSFAVLARRALLVDVLGHATLPGVVLAFIIATWLGGAPRSLVWLFPGGALSAGLAALWANRLVERTRLRPDAVLGLVLATGFGAGLLGLSYVQAQPTGQSAGLDRLLFGQAAALTAGDAERLFALAVSAIGIALVFGRRLNALAFDPGFAAVSGLDPKSLDRLLFGLLLVVALASLPAVGAVLAVALVVLPAASARLWSNSAPRIEALAAGLGAMAGYLGAAISRSAPGLSTGPLVVLLLGLAFGVSIAVAPSHGVLWSQRRRRRAIAGLRRARGGSR